MKTPEQWYDFAYDSNEEYTWTEIIKMVQNEAYNQCLEDLAKDDILPDKKVNIDKYKKK